MSHPRLRAAANPDKPAVLMSDGSASLTYGALATRANQGAHLLRSLGVERGETTGIGTGRHNDHERRKP